MRSIGGNSGLLAAVAALLHLSACSGAGGGRADDETEVPDGGVRAGDPPTLDGDVPAEPPPITAPTPGDWTDIIWDGWELEPGTEGYWCRRLTVAEDVWLTGIRSLAPRGTHHTTLGKDSGGKDGTFRCGGFSTGSELLFGSGVGADPIELNDGLAIKLTAGEQLLLNLHVFNTGDEVLTGTSGIEILALDQAAVKQEVAFVLAGVSGGLTVVPGESTQVGHCTLPEDVTVLSIMPHMHQRGVHQVVSALPEADAASVLFDGDYDFGEQTTHWLEQPATFPQGGKVEVVCTYQNETANTLQFGESSDDEMCYAGIYHYPRFTNGSTCQL